MHMINLTPVAPGVYNDHKADHIVAPPEGWAYIPEDFPLPATFPRLGGIEAENVTYIREENGTAREYTMLTVTAMSEGTMPETVVEQPSQIDRVEAQATYTAIMTDTLLEV